MGGIKRVNQIDMESDSYDTLGTILEFVGMASGAYMAPGASTAAGSIQNVMSGAVTGKGLGRMLGGYINPDKYQSKRDVRQGMSLALAGGSTLAKNLPAQQAGSRLKAGKLAGDMRNQATAKAGNITPANDVLSFFKDAMNADMPWSEAFNLLHQNVSSGWGLSRDMGWGAAKSLMEQQADNPVYLPAVPKYGGM